jgi:hypothetical protein
LAELEAVTFADLARDFQAFGGNEVGVNVDIH